MKPFLPKPGQPLNELLCGALGELVSAMSSLNMNASPIAGATGYLSETDGWAKHSMEHMNAASEWLNAATMKAATLNAQSNQAAQIKDLKRALTNLLAGGSDAKEYARAVLNS